MPRVHTRRQWGAKPPRHRARVLDRAPDHIVVHHTATTNTKDYSKAQAYRLSRIVQRFHMRQLGWDDIGEQLTISRGGYVMEGRNRSLAAIRNGRHVVGAQTLGYNDSTIGIENEGNYSNAPVPVQLWASLVDTCVWLCYAYDLDPFQAIVGHRDFGSTECPGDVLYQRLPELRWVVARRLGVQGERVATPGHGDLHVPNQDSASRTVLRGVPDPPAQPDGMA
ncbi:peptidoglycan recognition protein family protein [Thermomonospora echinospora]|nr:peptidoglycan recognition family protein [Thermomonospora echinospora]